MNIKAKHIIFWSLGIILSASLLFVNINSNKWIKSLYDTKNFSVLNQLSASRSQKSLDYYLGKIEDVCMGPMSNVITHLMFAAFCLLYVKSLTAKRFFIAVFIFLLLSKFNVLFYPFYGDAIGGPFVEGWWLAKNNFDYVSLYRQAGYSLGGPKVYMFSIYPTYLAILLKVIPSAKIFLIVNHLFVYAMAAAVVTLMREIVKKEYSLSIATLSALILLALPIFQSQSEAINMEMPYLCCSMFSVYFLTIRKFSKAFLFAVFSVLVKGHGVLNCGILAFICFSLFVFGNKEEHQVLSAQKRIRKNYQLLLYGGLIAFVGLFKVGTKFLLNDQHASAGMMKLFVGWASLKYMRHTYVYIISLIVFLIVVFFKEDRKIGNFINALIGKYYNRFVIYLSAGMWYLLFLNFYAVSPRYMLGVAPFALLCILFSFLVVFPRIEKFLPIFLVGVLCITSLNSYGLSHQGQGTTYHVLSEKSLQYRNDLNLSRKMAKLLEEKYSHLTIGAPFIIAQMLSIPELGYVKKPLDVISYGMPILYGNIKRFEGLKKISIMNTLWIGVPEQFKKSGNFSYPVHQGDKIIKRIELGDNFAVFFMGGLAIEKAWQYIMYKQLMLNKTGR